MKLYHRIFWRIYQYTYCRYLRSRWNIEFKYIDPEPKPPYVLLGNHGHWIDPYFIGAVGPYPICYMANEAGFTGFKKYASWTVRAFPKKKGQLDSGAVRKAFKLSKAGNVVGIFPEGDRTWDGETQKLEPSIVKLVRKFKTPLRLVHSQGNYLSWPRWAESKRNGKVTIEYRTLSLEEIEAMDDKALLNKIESTLYNNEIKNPSVQETFFSGEGMAEGISHLIWLCPTCGTHDSIRGEGSNIVCDKCGTKWPLDSHLSLKPTHDVVGADLKDWCDWQKSKIPELLKREGLITETSDVLLQALPDGPEVLGKLKLFGKKLSFQQEPNGDASSQWPVGEIKYFVDNFNAYADFGVGDKEYRLKFQGKSAYKWISIIDTLKKSIEF